MADNPIKNIAPLGFPWQTADPFLFCVHHEDFYPAGNDRMGPAVSLAGRPLGNDFTVRDGFRMYHGKQVPGFPAHPHCGFETVTIARKGYIDHSDSLGAAGRFGFGDVQWMTAGRGVQHCEMFPLIHQDQPNTVELFQIWLNLPRASKKADPHFAMLWSEDIPVYRHTDTNGRQTEVNVITGKLGDIQNASPAPHSWAANPANEVAIWTIRMEPNATWTLPTASEGINRAIYFYKGSSIQLASQSLRPNYMARLWADQSVMLENGDKEAFLLLLQGKPIDEPVVQYGPFVANSQSEIQQIIHTYQATEFGGWPWPSHEHAHPRQKGRFALYADGTEVLKG